MPEISMLAVDPVDQDDAFAALEVVDDLNGLIKTGQVEVAIDKDGTPRFYPVGE